jgi:hypothetical protein
MKSYENLVDVVVRGNFGVNFGFERVWPLAVVPLLKHGLSTA